MTMKHTKQKWYLFVDGKTTSVTNNRNEVDILKGVVIEITADEAASILALKLTRMIESEVNE
jgi:hypothetical protein